MWTTTRKSRQFSIIFAAPSQGSAPSRGFRSRRCYACKQTPYDPLLVNQHCPHQAMRFDQVGMAPARLLSTCTSLGTCPRLRSDLNVSLPLSLFPTRLLARWRSVTARLLFTLHKALRHSTTPSATHHPSSSGIVHRPSSSKTLSHAPVLVVHPASGRTLRHSTADHRNVTCRGFRHV